GAALPVLDGALSGAEEVLLQLAAAAFLAAQEPVEAGLGLLADRGDPGADLLLDEAGERVARAADDLPQHAERHLILLLLFLEDDLRQGDGGEVVLGAVVDDLHLGALLDHLGDLVERDVPALDGVVELPVRVALDDLRLAGSLVLGGMQLFGFSHGSCVAVVNGGPATSARPCRAAAPPCTQLPSSAWIAARFGSVQQGGGAAPTRGAGGLPLVFSRVPAIRRHGPRDHRLHAVPDPLQGARREGDRAGAEGPLLALWTHVPHLPGLGGRTRGRPSACRSASEGPRSIRRLRARRHLGDGQDAGARQHRLDAAQGDGAHAERRGLRRRRLRRRGREHRASLELPARAIAAGCRHGGSGRLGAGTPGRAFPVAATGRGGPGPAPRA